MSEDDPNRGLIGQIRFGHLVFEKEPDTPPAKDARRGRRRKGSVTIIPGFNDKDAPDKSE